MAGFADLSHKHLTWQGQLKLALPGDYATRGGISLKEQQHFVENGKKKKGKKRVLTEALYHPRWL